MTAAKIREALEVVCREEADDEPLDVPRIRQALTTIRACGRSLRSPQPRRSDGDR